MSVPGGKGWLSHCLWGGFLLLAFAASAQDFNQQVPPFAKFFEDFRELARERLTGEYRYSHFFGGAAFTRGDLARVLAGTLGQIQKNPALLTPQVRPRVERLIIEFQDELKAFRVETKLPDPSTVKPPVVPGQKPPVEPAEAEKPFVQIHGTNIATYRITEGEHNDAVSSLLDLTIEVGDFSSMTVIGQLDDSGTQDRDPFY